MTVNSLIRNNAIAQRLIPYSFLILIGLIVSIATTEGIPQLIQKIFLFGLIGFLIVPLTFYSLNIGLGILVLMAISIPSVEEKLGFDLFEGATFYPIEIMFIIIIFAWILGLLIQKEHLKKSPLNLPLVFFLAISVASCIYGADKNGWRAATYDLRPFLYYGLFFVVINTVKTKRQIATLITFMMVGAIIYCFEVMSMVLWQNNPLWVLVEKETARAGFSNLVNLLFLIPLILSTIIVKKEYLHKHLLRISILILFVFCVVAAQSRATWLVLLIVIILLLLLLRNKRFLEIQNQVPFLFLLSFLIVLLIVFSPSLSKLLGREFISSLLDRIYSLQRPFDISEMQTRIISANNAFQLIKESPLIGKGLGKYFIVYGREVGIYIDSSFLTLWLKVGLIGLCSLLWVFIRLFKSLWWGFRNSKDDFSTILYASLTTGFLGVFIISFQNVLLLKGKHIFVLAMLMGLVEVYNKIIEREKALNYESSFYYS